MQGISGTHYFTVLLRDSDGWLLQSYRGAFIKSRQTEHMLVLPGHPQDAAIANSVAHWINVIDQWMDR
jgi:hypothetical protein